MSPDIIVTRDTLTITWHDGRTRDKILI